MMDVTIDDHKRLHVHFDLPDTTEATLAACLDEWLSLCGRLSQELAKSDYAANYGQMSIEYETPDGLLGENSFAKLVAAHPALDDRVRDMLSAIIAYLKRQKHAYSLWDDEEFPVGNYLAYHVGRRNRDFLPLYAQLICTQDMDHETDQREHITGLIAAHTWCPEVEMLLGARLGAGAGQHGHQQFITELPLIRENVSTWTDAGILRHMMEGFRFAKQDPISDSDDPDDPFVFDLMVYTGFDAAEAQAMTAAALALNTTLGRQPDPMWQTPTSSATTPAPARPDSGFGSLPTLESGPIAAAIKRSRGADRVTSLEFSGDDDASDADLQGIATLPNLTTVTLDAPALTDAATAELLACPALLNINLGPNCTGLSDASLGHIAALPKLHGLTLRASHFSPAGYQKLADHPTLAQLRIRQNALADDDLLAFGRLRSATTLSIESNRIGDKGLAHVKAWPSITTLELWKAQTATLEPLIGAEFGATLDTVTLQHTALSGPAFAWIMSSPNLSWLQLEASNIGPDDAKQVAGPSPVTSFWIQRGKLGDEGLVHLLDQGALDQLERLDLTRCKLTDASIPHLTRLKTLENLCLCGAKITDDSIDHLIALDLRHLCICGTKVTAKGIRRLQASKDDPYWVCHDVRL